MSRKAKAKRWLGKKEEWKMLRFGLSRSLSNQLLELVQG
jgi:hypothetical protein